MGPAGVGDLAGTVPLGEHDERTAGCLELLDVGVHAAGRRRAERTGRQTLGGLGGAGVVDAVVGEVVRHLLPGIEALLDAGVGDVAGHNHGP